MTDPKTLMNPAAGVHVRGAGHYRRRATFGLRLGAGVVDGALVLAAFFLAHRALRLSPVPEPWWVAACIFLLGAIWSASRALFARTAGDAAWKLRGAAPGLMEPLLRPEKLMPGELAGGVFLTALSIVACAWSIDQAVFRQPIWARAEALGLDAYLPDMASNRWEILPFFFSLGAWPKIYGEKPVFYSLPYEKGPPSRFVGHLTARWEDPGTRVTFEGPKTPQAPVSAQPGERTPREHIRQCLLGEDHSWSCLKIREATLLRHLNDMQERLTGKSGGNTALKMKWRVRWFLVRNAAIAPAEQAQGIYLSAEDEGRGEERYVLITENGTHQAISLDYPNPGSENAKLARQTFEQSIRSLRASDELAPGRAWVERQLTAVKIGALLASDASQAAANSEAIEKLAETQALLLAEITVQPGMFESYFQLGRTSLLLNRISRSGPNAGHLQGLELAAVAKPMIQSAYRYAQDVAPQDPRTTQLQGFWFESQKP